MKYVVKEPPYTGLTLDADSLMREFNRAMHIVYSDVDQNNVKDEAIFLSRIVGSISLWQTSTAVLGTSDTSSHMHFAVQDSGYSHSLDLPTSTFGGSQEARSIQSFWSFISASSTEDLSYSLTLNADMQGTVVVTGQIAISADVLRGNERICAFDVRITDNGMPLDHIFTTSCEVDGGYLPIYVSVNKLFTAGQHVFKVQGRDRCQIETGGVQSTVADTAIYFYGFTR